MITITEIGKASNWSPELTMGRTHERQHIAIEIILHATAGNRASRISDLSMGGCFVESLSDFRQGERLTFDLKTPDGTLLRFYGQVAYVLPPYGFGLEFVDLSDEHKAFLERAMAESGDTLT